MVIPPPSLKLDLLYRQPYFVGVPLSVVEVLANAMILHQYPAGEVLFLEGDAPRGLYIVKEGRVRLYRSSFRGRDVILRIVREGDSFNEVPVFDGGRNPVNAMAMDDTEIWIVAAEVIREQLQISPELAMTVVQALCQRTRKLVGKVTEISLYPVTSRLAKLLLELPPERLSGGNRLSQEDLAAYLGTVREVLARSLRQLQRKGAIQVRRGHIDILDEGVLRNVAMMLEDQ